MRFEAVIFDLDGVICFTDEYHYLAWKTVADEINVPFDRKVNNRLRGVSRMESLDIILEKYAGTPLTKDEKSRLAERKNELYREYLKQMSPADLPVEVRETLDALRGLGLKLAIGSSSKNAPFILSRIGLEGYFDAVSDGNGITRSKPDPEVFVNAARLLGIPPEKCLVAEDAVSGARAAHAADMKAACLGDAAEQGAGDWNMKSIRELVGIASA